MITSLYGLWIEDTKTKGCNPIGYFDTWEELDEEIKTIRESIEQLPANKKLFKVEHEYNRTRDVITGLNFSRKIYIPIKV